MEVSDFNVTLTTVNPDKLTELKAANWLNFWVNTHENHIFRG